MIYVIISAKMLCNSTNSLSYDDFLAIVDPYDVSNYANTLKMNHKFTFGQHISGVYLYLKFILMLKKKHFKVDWFLDSHALCCKLGVSNGG